ncbi:MAG: hypothetical protein RLZZ505_69 [Verrucomicrobiota bacterium]|jgi:hypothetical protein
MRKVVRCAWDQPIPARHIRQRLAFGILGMVLVFCPIFLASALRKPSSGHHSHPAPHKLRLVLG